MLAYSVSPPSDGISRADSSEARAGAGLNEESACQIWLARLFSTCLSVGAAMLPSAPMFVSTISLLPAPFAPARVASNGPNRSLNRICAASSISWPGNTSTEKRSNASHTSAKVASSTFRLRSSPVTRAPRTGCSLVIVSTVVLLAFG
jgi:hypothetical protein